MALFTYGATESRELFKLVLNFRGGDNQRKRGVWGDYDNMTGEGIVTSRLFIVPGCKI